MEVGFEYTYKNNSEIIAAIESISSFSGLEFTILGALIVCICVAVYYLFPILYLSKKFFDRQNQKAKRKLMLKQISTQREIEDEIEAEIEVTAQAQAQEEKK